MASHLSHILQIGKIVVKERCANAFSALHSTSKAALSKTTTLPGEHLASVRRKRAAHSLVNIYAEIIILSIYCYVNLQSNCLGVGKSDLMHRGTETGVGTEWL